VPIHVALANQIAISPERKEILVFPRVGNSQGPVKTHLVPVNHGLAGQVPSDGGRHVLLVPVQLQLQLRGLREALPEQGLQGAGSDVSREFRPAKDDGSLFSNSF
jgi:hypothetical protein